MLLHAQLTVEGLNADVMQDDIVSGGNGTHFVEDALCYSRPWHGMDDDIRIGQYAPHGFGCLAYKLFRFLEGQLTRERKRKVCKIRVSGAPHACLIHR